MITVCLWIRGLFEGDTIFALERSGQRFTADQIILHRSGGYVLVSPVEAGAAVIARPTRASPQSIARVRNLMKREYIVIERGL